MSTPNYAQILTYRYPNLQWKIMGNNYLSLQVFNGAIPLQSDLDALWAGVETQIGNQTEIEIKTQIVQNSYAIQIQLIELMRAVITGDKTVITAILSLWDNT